MDVENKELFYVANELIRIKKMLFFQCREDVNRIIDNKITSENYIESTFDRLLDLYDDEDSMELFSTLIAYVETFNEDISTFYRRQIEVLSREI